MAESVPEALDPLGKRARREVEQVAIARADIGTRTRHAFGCHIDGGPEIDGFRWRSRHKRGLPGRFRCEKCRSSIEDRIESAIRVLDSRRPA